MKSFLPWNWGMQADSRIARGRTWPAPTAEGSILALEIYRYDPDLNDGPRIDVYHIDCDDCEPMVLDALIKIKNEIDPTLTFRRSCREGVCGSCSMNINGRNWLACTQAIDDINGPIRVFPLSHMRVIKDLVVDQTHLFQQHLLIQPWLRTESPEPERERLQSPDERAQLDGFYECILCFSCTGGCPSYW